MNYAGLIVILAIGYFAWKFTARGAYESAEYTVLDSAGPFETREYPELFLATTNTKLQMQGNDGSFMRTIPLHQAVQTRKIRRSR